VRILALAFLLGTFALQRLPELPEPRLALAGVAALLGLALVRSAAARWVLLAAAGVSLGFGHAAWRAHARMAEELPFAWEGRDIHVVGVVADLPQARSRGTRFLFHVEQAVTADAVVPGRVSLNWYPEVTRAGRVDPPAVVPGERWSLTLRFKRVRGLANPHAFDFEPWALERGIRATGYVRGKAAAERVDARVDGWPYTLHRWRSEIREAMRERLGEAALAGVVVALAIGDQEAIAPAHWDVFWRTGVGHLMSISGLHITMLAGLGFALAFFAWARVPALALRLPARKAAVVAGTAVALGYALMTGFAVPAQRTVVMLAAIAACVLADRHGSASRVLAVAVLAVLLADPWAVLAGGFWLSFGAVAAIFYAMALRTGRRGRLRAALVEQAAVTIVMVPLVIALFQEFSLASPFANALAIPVVSWVVVPLAIAGAFLDLAAALEAAHAALAALMAPLEWLAASPHAMVESHAPLPWTVAAAIAGCAWLLAPRGVPLRSLGALWIVPLFAFAPARPAWGEAWVDVLDVGNGLAIVVRTTGHALAYDAGPSWGEESDSGERIVVPYLRGEGIARLDALVVSHADDDHAGGAISVAALREPAWLLSSLAPEDALHTLVPLSTPCAAGQSWRWDGVQFAVLHPARLDPGPLPHGARDDEQLRHPGRRNAAMARGPISKPNDQSCVIRISTRGAAILLTGDIEARSESGLLGREMQLDADLLLVPHHGSRSSSTAEFVDAVAPTMALVSVGHRNRFGHPHPTVAARYAARGIALRRTDREGALRAVLPAESGRPVAVERLVRAVRYWSDRRPQ
jgi:competence protein ComEC